MFVERLVGGLHEYSSGIFELGPRAFCRAMRLDVGMIVRLFTLAKC